MQGARKFFQGRVTRNTVWLIAGKFMHKLIALLVSIWTARLLGPENYGVINYAAAYTTFFVSLSALGLQSVVIKSFIEDSESEGDTLGTTLVMQSLASLLSMAVIFLIVSIADRGEKETIAVVMLCSLGLFFQSFTSLNYWFQARLLSKYAAIATTLAYAISSGYKIILLLNEKTVEWFAFATSIDHICVALILFISYRREVGPKLTFSWKTAQGLLGNSYHYILSGMMVSVYAATDRLMLKHMIDEASVAYYGVAISLCNAWTFILEGIIESLYPVVLGAFRVDLREFERRNKQLYAVIFYSSAAAACLITILAEPGIRLLYGPAYLPVTGPLCIITWYVAFSYLGGARNAWIICNNCQKYLLWLYMGAAVVNVILNALLIPALGTEGAAIASLVTQISTILVFPALIRELRPNLRLMLDAVFLRGLR